MKLQVVYRFDGVRVMQLWEGEVHLVHYLEHPDGADYEHAMRNIIDGAIAKLFPETEDAQGDKK